METEKLTLVFFRACQARGEREPLQRERKIGRRTRKPSKRVFAKTQTKPSRISKNPGKEQEVGELQRMEELPALRGSCWDAVWWPQCIGRCWDNAKKEVVQWCGLVRGDFQSLE